MVGSSHTSVSPVSTQEPHETLPTTIAVTSIISCPSMSFTSVPRHTSRMCRRLSALLVTNSIMHGDLAPREAFLPFSPNPAFFGGDGFSTVAEPTPAAATSSSEVGKRSAFRPCRPEAVSVRTHAVYHGPVYTCEIPSIPSMGGQRLLRRSSAASSHAQCAGDLDSELQSAPQYQLPAQASPP